MPNTYNASGCQGEKYPLTKKHFLIFRFSTQRTIKPVESLLTLVSKRVTDRICTKQQEALLFSSRFSPKKVLVSCTVFRAAGYFQPSLSAAWQKVCAQ
jgi:hypothetical protein